MVPAKHSRDCGNKSFISYDSNSGNIAPQVLGKRLSCEREGSPFYEYQNASKSYAQSTAVNSSLETTPQLVTKIGSLANAGEVESVSFTATNKGFNMIQPTHEPGTFRPLFNN